MVRDVLELCENGLAYACDEAGDPTPRDEDTDRLMLALRVTFVDLVTVFPLRVTLVVRVTLVLRLMLTLRLA